MLPELDLAGRMVLVTGASSGIGRATAVLLSRLHARLVLAGRDETRLAETKALLNGNGHRVTSFDLAHTEEILLWLKRLAEQEGPFAGLVHSAGVHLAAPIRVLSPRRLDELLRVNVASAMILARAFLQPGCAARPASLVFVSSVSALAGSPGLSAYGASKAAIIGLTKALALELAGERIRVNCVAPGLVETELTERLRNSLLPEQFQAIASQHPLGIGSPGDVAHAIAFLLADTSRWITGSTLVVDGGYSAH